jgi:hypothetical protein
MSEVIYVILVNGRPHRNDSAIRTYKTVISANKSAMDLARWRKGSVITIGEFSAVNVVEVGGAV